MERRPRASGQESSGSWDPDVRRQDERSPDTESSGSWDPDVGRQDERSPDTEDKDRTSG